MEQNLKSNMDRFIEDFRMKALTFITNLKSNMDRFIDFLISIVMKLKTI